MSRIPLTKLQKEILNEFYSKKPTKVLFDKKQRKTGNKARNSGREPVLG